MNKLKVLGSILLVLCLSVSVWAQPADNAGEYYFLNTQASGTLEKELNQSAAQGWRLLLLPKAFGSSTMGALLKKPANVEVKYEYKVLAATRIGTLENEFKAAVNDGYDFRGIIETGRVFIGGETLMVMEREAGQKSSRSEYIFLNTKKESTLEKEMDGATSQGYAPIGFTRSEDRSVKQQMFGIMAGSAMELTMILGRSRETPAAQMGREYKVLTTLKRGTMEKEMNQAAKEGYEFWYAAPGSVTIMVRDPKVKTAQYEYKILGTNRVNTMEKEMNEMSGSGFAYRATTTGGGGLATIFEKKLTGEAATKYETRLLTKPTDEATNKTIQELQRSGYELIDVTNMENFLLVLQKASDK
jgi:hypothetical protein